MSRVNNTINLLCIIMHIKIMHKIMHKKKQIRCSIIYDDLFKGVKIEILNICQR